VKRCSSQITGTALSVTIQSDRKPIHMFEIFEYLFKHNMSGREYISVRNCGCLQQCY